MLSILGYCIRVNKKINKVFETKDKFENTLSVYNESGSTEKLKWYTSIPHKTFFIEELKFNELNKKYRIWHENSLFSPTTEEQAIKLINKKPKVPWLWIGSDEEIDMTNYMNEYLIVGNVITLQVLRSIVPDIDDWNYMCPSTFELKEFPIDGIQIEEDDS